MCFIRYAAVCDSRPLREAVKPATLMFRSSPAPAHLALGADVLKQRQVGGSELSDALQASLVDDGYQVQIMRLGEAVR